MAKKNRKVGSIKGWLEKLLNTKVAAAQIKLVMEAFLVAVVR